MRIVQISDLHIGGLFKQEAFDTLTTEVNKGLKPDLIVFSGDLTDDGLVFQLKKAQDEIKKFDCKNIIVFPGNHDYRHTGYLIFKKFFPSSLKRVYEFDEGKVILVTVNTARPDRDEGEIGRSQILWMENTLSKYNEYTEDKNIPRVKIVCMHHHLIQIPDTGYTNVVGISDAGDALRACLESGVDVVICGHKHRPWMWNLGKVLIVYAGTACSWRYRGVFDDTYNIIDIKNNKVHVDMKMVGGKKVPLAEIVKRFKQEVRAQSMPS